MTTSAALVPIQPVFTDPERLALAGFLAGDRGLTREAYTLDLRQFTTWCRACSLSLFAVRRAGFGRPARAGLQVGRGQASAPIPAGTPAVPVGQLRHLIQDVFARACIAALHPALAIPVAVLIAGAAACLLLRRSPAPARPGNPARPGA